MYFLEGDFFTFIIFRGVILMRLEHAGKIQSASLISATETETDEIEAEAAADSVIQ